MPPPTTSSSHFQGKNVSAHLKEARIRGAMATAETHGTTLLGHLSAGFDSAQDLATLFLLLWAATKSFALSPPLLTALFFSFGLGFILWTTGRSALRGWGRLERLHQVIEEERWEIEHHREQEKAELRELYQAKGFSGKLLDEVVNVLMADDSRLLRVMLEEELGLSLEVYEHPLKQAVGAAVGAFFTGSLGILALYFLPPLALPLLSLLIILFCSWVTAKQEKRNPLNSVVWNVSLALFATAGCYFLLTGMINR